MTPTPITSATPPVSQLVGDQGLSSTGTGGPPVSTSAPETPVQVNDSGQREGERNISIAPSKLKNLLDKFTQLKSENEKLIQQLDEQAKASFPPLDQIESNSPDSPLDTNHQLSKAIFEQSHDAIVVLKDNRSLSANEIALTLLDCSTNEIQEANFYSLLARKFKDLDANWEESILQQLASEGVAACELRRDTPEGELWIDLRFRKLETASESNVLVVGQDVSLMRRFQSELVRSHDFLHHTINSVAHSLAVKSADLKYVLANHAFCHLVDRPFEEIRDRTSREVMGFDTSEGDQRDRRALETGECSVNVELLKRPDGRVSTLSTHRSRFHDPVTGAAYVVTASRDMTAELATQRRLRLLASVFENTHESVAILDKDGALHEANPEFIGTVGVSRDDLVSRSLKEFVDWEAANFEDVIASAVDGKPWFGHVKLLKGDQDPVSCWLSLSPSKSRKGEITNLIAMFSDITQIESTRRELHRQALHDNLTSLPNRRYYRQRITEMINSDTDRTLRFGVSFLDLDDFKYVNDTLGHDAGDRLLIEVSRRIQTQLGDECFMARFGGDEFALLLPDVSGEESRAQEYSAKIVKALSEPFQLGEHEVNVGVSVGTTLYPDDATDVESLMRQADVAMYRAKDEGKNTVRLFSRELVDVIERRQEMLMDLRKAIDADQLHLVYQPKLDLATNRIVGCEALLRWQLPDGTHVAPDKFIALAEESGLINRLGDQMFQSVFRQAKRWSELGLMQGAIAINLTERQLKEPQLLDRLLQAIEQRQLRPEWLELEITENAIMSDVGRAMELMKGIRDAGIRIAIDDFGTGYSSLGYIKNFPVQSLKLDNLFVDGLPDDTDAVAVAKTVLSLADGLNLKVIAEGVETEAQREFLRGAGCDMVQGYLISPPMEAEEYERWVLERENGS